MTYASAEDLLSGSTVRVEDVTLPSGRVVQVRGLTRLEVLEVAQAEGVGGVERAVIARAMVAPKLTEEQVGQWQAADLASELDAVSSAINRLSRLGKAGLKDATKSPAVEPKP